MRKEDIIITTPKKSVIYAIGSNHENQPGPWLDYNGGEGQRKVWKPGYVLGVTGSYAIVLRAGAHPDSKQAEAYDNHGAPWGNRKAQATLLEALDYTYEDYKKRAEVERQHSHWAEIDEREAAKKALKKLKPLPEGWEVRQVPTSHVRSLWAPYVLKHAKILAAREQDLRAQQQATLARVEKKNDIVNRLVKLGLVTEEETTQYPLSNRSNGSVELNIEAFEKLLVLAEVGAEVAKSVSGNGGE